MTLPIPLKLSTSYQHHTQMCIQMTERMSEEDAGTLVVITSDQKISMSTKVMQMFSPMFRDLVADTSSVGGSDKKEPTTVILPDYNSKMVLHLMNFLMYGELVVVGKDEKKEAKTKVSNLAKTLGIRLNLDSNSCPDNGSTSSECFVEDSSVSIIKIPITSSIERENFEDSSREELKQEVSLGINDNVSKDYFNVNNVEMPGGKNPRVTDQFQEDSRSRDPIRNMNDIDMRLDEDPTCKDYRGKSEEATLFLEETLRDYGSIENGEDEEGDEGDGKYADAIEEDRAPNQNDVGSPDHGGARDVDDVGHRRVLRTLQKPMPVHGDQSMIPPPSNSTKKSKKRAMNGKYTFDRVTKKYLCSICPKKFSSSATVGRHIKTAHEGVRYPCASCEKTFTQLGNLQRHMKFAH